MPAVQVNVTWRDIGNRRGIFGFWIDAVYDDGVYAELQAFLQDAIDASYCAIEKVSLTKSLDDLVLALTNNEPAGGDHPRIDDQCILAFRSATGLDTKLAIPGPLPALFLQTGPTQDADVDPEAAEVEALIATGITVPLLVAKEASNLTFRKGWRKGQHHT